jgi:hypothetical protein
VSLIFSYWMLLLVCDGLQILCILKGLAPACHTVFNMKSSDVIQINADDASTKWVKNTIQTCANRLVDALDKLDIPWTNFADLNVQ